MSLSKRRSRTVTVPSRPFDRLRGLSQQVDVGSGKVVNQVQIGHVHAFGVDGNGVLAVFFGLEVHGHLALAFAEVDGIVFAVLREVNLSIVAETELGQCRAFVEADDGVVKS